jgi:hypothetical protein
MKTCIKRRGLGFGRAVAGGMVYATAIAVWIALSGAV